MTMTRSEAQIQWAAADFTDVASGTEEASDAMAIDVDCIAGAVTIYADHQGTPIADDVVDCYLAYTTGNIDGTAGDDYDTLEARDLYGPFRLDTFASALDGAAPDGGIVQRTIEDIPTGVKGVKVVSANLAAATIRIRARLTQQKSGT